MKKAPLVLSAVIAAAVISGCSYEQDIDEFIEKYKPELTEIAQGYLDGSCDTADFKGVKCNGLYEENENKIVMFYYSSFEIAPSSTDYGFYYSSCDAPMCFGENPEQTAENEWKWTGPGDNYGKVIRIDDNWYYFDAHC